MLIFPVIRNYFHMSIIYRGSMFFKKENLAFVEFLLPLTNTAYSSCLTFT